MVCNARKHIQRSFSLSTHNSVFKKRGLAIFTEKSLRHEWYELHVPENSNAEDYVRRMKNSGQHYKMPLKMILLDPTTKVTAHACELGDYNQPIDPSFSWPEPLMAAMNCVESELNCNLQPPKLTHSTTRRWVKTLTIIARIIIIPNISAAYEHSKI